MKKISILFYFVFLQVVGFAQGSDVRVLAFWDDPIAHPMMPIYILGAVVVILIIIVIGVVYYIVRVLNLLIDEAAKERAERLGMVYEPRTSWWKRMFAKVNKFTPVEKEETIMLDHDYDGIKELDNHLPPWWKYLFYLTIIWSIGYMIVFHVAKTLPLQEEEYQEQISQSLVRKVTAIDISSLEFTGEGEIVSAGKVLYETNCASCHRHDGGGDLGPNLTDDYWLHGGGIQNIYRTINNGVSGTSMISWKQSLKPEDIKSVAFFVMSLQGTNPENPKPPQGEKEENVAPTESMEAEDE